MTTFSPPNGGSTISVIETNQMSEIVKEKESKTVNQEVRNVQQNSTLQMTRMSDGSINSMNQSNLGVGLANQPSKKITNAMKLSTVHSLSNCTKTSQLGMLSLCAAVVSPAQAPQLALLSQPEINPIPVLSRINARKQTPSERLQRSRERNRMHARKTRQRKKEHMQNLQKRADELKKEQLDLRQTIKEKNTANILVGLFSIGVEKSCDVAEDPKVEELLRRPAEEIPDASKIPELPALILPGQHNSKKHKGKGSSSSTDKTDSNNPQHQFPDDGIDYVLLGKDRSKCTPDELDKIRRERNRMHAKRTRDRKRIFMEEMEELIKTLEAENKLLKDHLTALDGENENLVTGPVKSQSPDKSPNKSNTTSTQATSEPGKPQSVDQIKSLIDAAGSVPAKTEGTATSPTSVPTTVSASEPSGNSSCDDTLSQGSGERHTKRRRLETSIPCSITTSNTNC